MVEIQPITSLQNDRVKNLVKLRRRRQRDSQAVFIIEEPLVIERAVGAGYPLQTVYFCTELLHTGRASDLMDSLRRTSDPGLEFCELARPVMEKVSYREKPAGLLVVAPQQKRQLADLSPTTTCLYIVLEGVEKPGNLGAVLRIADGAGADAVLVCGGGVDLFNPNVLRASRGACFSVPTIEADAERIHTFLTGHHVQMLATSPASDTVYTDADMSGPTAIILGAEHEGLSDFWLAEADQTVKIPMNGVCDSLNVSAATALLFYEAVRQRR